MSGDAGGRVFFSSVRRSLEFEDEIRLLSVGVDIGSSTSHLVFSRLVLERLDNRYVVSERTLLHESEVLLTPYADAQTIDAAALGRFIERQYERAGLRPEQIDSGALILTGVAVRRRNARAIGELFAAQAGKFVAVSAGDALETTLAAHGAGAVARSISSAQRVMNVDIGGGTSKIALCEGGTVIEQTALDVGARLLVFDARGRLERSEEAGRRLAAEAGLALVPGTVPDAAGVRRLVGLMADRLFEAMCGGEPSRPLAGLLRLDPLSGTRRPALLGFSGGVSEYLYGRDSHSHGDLGPALAREILARTRAWRDVRLEEPQQGIRATVLGASQYTVQVSGSTIFVEPTQALPLRDVPVVLPALPLDGETLDPAAISAAIGGTLRRLDLHDGSRPVALCYRWQGSATFARLDAFCRGVQAGLAPLLDRGQALVLVGDGDIGGLLGIHFHLELQLDQPLVSVDGIRLQEFDHIDIGALLETSGAVPVVIKSLVFPTSAAPGRAGLA